MKKRPGQIWGWHPAAALVIALACPVPVVAEGGGQVAASPTVPAVTPQAFDFARHTDARFDAERRAGLNALMAAKDRAGLQAARMQLGALYLAHLMLPEAGSLLGAVDAEDLDPAMRARLGALRAGVRIMAGRALTPQMAGSVLAPANRGWADYDFWAALNAIRAGDPPALRVHLSPALDRLGAYPPVYAEACLPLFLGAALDLGDRDLARRVAERFDGYPALKARPVYSYLLGRAALAVNRSEAARAAFGEAAQGQGPYAQRAVLALVDLGLRGRSMTPAQARILLGAVLADWQGGEIELLALRKLAHVDRMLGNWPGMALTLGQLLRDFPLSEDARPAAVQADGLIEAYYQYAFEGKVPLARLLSLHRRLVPLYRFDAAFEEASEKLADHLMGLGATAMAAEEYGRIHETLLLGEKAGKWPADAARLARLKLGEAEALAAGGRTARAAAALAGIGTPPPALEERAKALAARLDLARGDAAAAAGITLSKPSEGDLRMLAGAASEAGNWSAARDRYRRLWAEYPARFGGADAINLLLAAARLGDRETAQAVRAAYPDLAGATPGGRLAGALLTGPDAPGPLSRRGAEDKLNRAQAVAEGVGGALSETEQPAKE